MMAGDGAMPLDVAVPGSAATGEVDSTAPQGANEQPKPASTEAATPAAPDAGQTADPAATDAKTTAPNQRALPAQLVVGGFGSSHPGTMGFAFGDGSVRSISTGIVAGVFQQLAHRADGKLLDAESY
jgi:prepilin-type processing-associated H-X9-DG protein